MSPGILTAISEHHESRSNPAITAGSQLATINPSRKNMRTTEGITAPGERLRRWCSKMPAQCTNMWQGCFQPKRSRAVNHYASQIRKTAQVICHRGTQSRKIVLKEQTLSLTTNQDPTRVCIRDVQEEITMKPDQAKRASLRRRQAHLYNMARKIKSPQQLALILKDLPNDHTRDAVYKMLKPMLRFQVPIGVPTVENC